LLAYAVKELFPEAQVTIGPVIENGFYYDFSYQRPFTPEDLEAIEKKMAELAKKDEPVERKVLPRDDAVAYFKGIGEAYKAEIIASIPQGEDVSLYSEGKFTDLCRGPPDTRSPQLRDGAVPVCCQRSADPGYHSGWQPGCGAHPQRLRAGAYWGGPARPLPPQPSPPAHPSSATAAAQGTLSPERAIHTALDPSTCAGNHGQQRT
jgi:hypothetical protein